MNQESVKGFVVYIKAVSRDSRPQMSSEPGRRITGFSLWLGVNVHPGRISGMLLPSDNEGKLHPCLHPCAGVSH